MQGPGASRVAHQLREEGWADRATGARARRLGAAGAWASAEQVHEESELVVKVKGRISRLAETHPVALALLVLLALPGAQCGATSELSEAKVEIRVKAEVAGLGVSALAWPHTPHGEGAGDQVVAECEGVCRARPE